MTERSNELTLGPVLIRLAIDEAEAYGQSGCTWAFRLSTTFA